MSVPLRLGYSSIAGLCGTVPIGGAWVPGTGCDSGGQSGAGAGAATGDVQVVTGSQ